MRKVISDSHLRIKVRHAVCQYVEYFVKEFQLGQIKKEAYDDVLLFCAEILKAPFLEDYQEDINSIIMDILNDLKEDIYKGNTEELFYMGSYKGIGNIAFSLRILNDKGMKLTQFQTYFDDLIRDYYNSHIGLYYEKQTSPILYDTIYGLSGLLNYYLDDRKDQKCAIEGLMRYLISLTGKNESGIINYFIMELPPYAIKESESVPYLDFGMAHGILGPLIVMSKAKNQGFYADGIDEAIQILSNLYKDYTVQAENKILKFPVQLGVKEYEQKAAKRLSFNCGWCYGNGSIALGLMRSAQYCGSSDEYEYYKEALLNILSDPIEQQGLDEPIICHGYASVLMLQMSAYFQTNDIRFLDTLDKNVYVTLKCHEKYWEKTEYRKEFSMLEGANGVMLALLKTMGGKIASNRLLLLE
ncbi:hypothetical protein FMM74_015035 [Lachnospiraceae bacterium MD308]|nr:hypothetical protein [Lachnospiraceae bacterium MD308]